MPLTLNTSGVVVIDDSNASVSYKGAWAIQGVSAEYDHTTHGTAAAGATATISFRGTSVAVYGTLGPQGTPTTIYNIDDANPVTFKAPAVASPVYNTLFYQSPDLSDGEHTLTVTIFHGSVYWLDYILYLPSSAQTPPPAPSSSPSPDPTTHLTTHPTTLPPVSPPESPSSSTRFAPTTNHSSSTSSATSQITPSIGSSFVTTTILISSGPASSGPASSALAVQTSNPTVFKKSMNTGPIVGGSLGAALILLLGLVAFLLYRRRNRDKTMHEMEPFPASQSRYMYNYSTTQTSPKAVRTYISRPSLWSHNSKTTSAVHNSETELVDYNPMEAPIDTLSLSQSSPTSPSRIRLHQDGGVRIAGGAPRPSSLGTTVDIPPLYGRYSGSPL